MNSCEWCNYKDSKWLIYKSIYWSVYLADVQDYVGRCILVLNRHCECISDLNTLEWIDLKSLIDQLEQIYKEVLGAELCNWSCLMNNFYKETNPNPHLHFHVRPRYKNPITINHHSYVDVEFAHHYALKKEPVLIAEDRQVLFEQIKSHFKLKVKSVDILLSDSEVLRE